MAPVLPPLEGFLGGGGPQAQTKAATEATEQKGAQRPRCELRPPLQQPPHGSIRDATGHHLSKTRQIRVHIQGQTVLADPAPGPHTDRRHLLPLEPHAGEPLQSRTLEPQLRQQIDHHPFQLAQIEVKVSAMALQVEHGIEHQLTRAVVGHLPAAINAKQRGWRV